MTPFTPPALLIIGASARAAACSAQRAGLNPWCVDLFADVDLRRICPAYRLVGRYPSAFEAWFDQAPPGPWLYTGGLENHPTLLHRLAKKRPLWGIVNTALSRSRNPLTLHCHHVGIANPQLISSGEQISNAGSWLLKPKRGAGGSDIRFAKPGEEVPRDRYAQQFIEGVSLSALYVADGREALLLGATRQLVGEEWLNAAPFRYCGNIGPLTLSYQQADALTFLANDLTQRCGLRGLFGVDGIQTVDQSFWPVEINPRYTAAIEVLERATGLAALDRHRRVFLDKRDALAPVRSTRPGMMVGKAILFARQDLVFPDHGPWTSSDDFADIPDAGAQIAGGQPILTFFAEATSETACTEQLRARARELSRWL